MARTKFVRVWLLGAWSELAESAIALVHEPTRPRTSGGRLPPPADSPTSAMQASVVNDFTSELLSMSRDASAEHSDGARASARPRGRQSGRPRACGGFQLFAFGASRLAVREAEARAELGRAHAELLATRELFADVAGASSTKYAKLRPRKRPFTSPATFPLGTRPRTCWVGGKCCSLHSSDHSQLLHDRRRPRYHRAARF